MAKSEKATKDELKQARKEAMLAKKEAVKARAEAAKAKAATVGGGHIGGFVNFVREKGVVGLAVGLAIGTAATALVAQIVSAVITPSVSLLLSLLGLGSLSGLNWVVKRNIDGTPLITYAVGDLIDAIIKFMAIAFVIYFVVIGLKLDRLDKKKDE